jgi:hypothetical protein
LKRIEPIREKEEEMREGDRKEKKEMIRRRRGGGVGQENRGSQVPEKET